MDETDSDATKTQPPATDGVIHPSLNDTMEASTSTQVQEPEHTNVTPSTNALSTPDLDVGDLFEGVDVLANMSTQDMDQLLEAFNAPTDQGILVKAVAESGIMDKPIGNEDYYYFDEQGNVSYNMFVGNDCTPIPSCSEGFIPTKDPNL
jgi:hypothetical protein